MPLHPELFICPVCMSSSRFIRLHEYSEKTGEELPADLNDGIVIGCWTCRGVYSWGGVSRRRHHDRWVFRPEMSPTGVKGPEGEEGRGS